jgi:RNA polymerase sigma-70 factor (ECF subfamily)
MLALVVGPPHASRSAFRATVAAMPDAHAAGASPTDEELMDRYCAGDATAFTSLFRRYAARLARFVAPIVGAAQAPDVVQVAFLKLHEHRAKYQSGARFSSWIFTIARNTGLDHVRSAPRRREVHDDVEVAAEPIVRDPLRDARVRIAIDGLPAEQRDVVLLYWFGGLSLEEVGEVLGASHGAVRARAHRAYDKLRAVLGDLAPEVST